MIRSGSWNQEIRSLFTNPCPSPYFRMYAVSDTQWYTSSIHFICLRECTAHPVLCFRLMPLKSERRHPSGNKSQGNTCTITNSSTGRVKKEDYTVCWGNFLKWKSIKGFSTGKKTLHMLHSFDWRYNAYLRIIFKLKMISKEGTSLSEPHVIFYFWI